MVRDGVTSHALCCHAPSLECHLLENTSVDGDQVSHSSIHLLSREIDDLDDHILRFLIGCSSLAGQGVLSHWLDSDRL